MDPEGSLPHSQAPTTRPYPGLAQSSPPPLFTAFLKGNVPDMFAYPDFTKGLI